MFIKKIIALVVVIVLVSNDSFSQIVMQDKNYIYQNLLDQVNSDKYTPVYYKTSLKTLKKIDFKKTDFNRWLGKDSAANWKPFFDAINLDTLSETELDFKSGLHPFTTRMFEKDKNGPHPLLILSPVLFSADKDLAICSVFNWQGEEAASETIYLMELIEGKWEVVRFLLVSIA